MSTIRRLYISTNRVGAVYLPQPLPVNVSLRISCAMHQVDIRFSFQYDALEAIV